MMFLIMLLVACGGTAVTPPTPTPEPEPVQEAPAETTADGVRTFVVDPAASQASYIVNEEFFADALSKLGIEAGKTVVVGTTPGVTGEIQFNLPIQKPVKRPNLRWI